MRALAVLSLHTSPLAQPGTGDGGGMNVYVRELSAHLARSGVRVEVFTRADRVMAPAVVNVEPGFRVHHVPAGPLAPMAKEALPELVDEWTAAVASLLQAQPVDAIHANYWLSGLAGHSLKHQLDLPLISTFHTLDRVKAEASPEEEAAAEPARRAHAEAEIIGCSDAVLASCSVEATQLSELYGAPADRVEIVAPGVDLAFFGPGDQGQARRAVGLEAGVPIILFVGRIQPLKGLTVAVEALAQLRSRGSSRVRRATLVVVGGPSGPHGVEELAAARLLLERQGLADAVRWVPPQPHELLSTYFRAADVCVVPSRSESFGLVALEAAACGIPVVAAAVGGLTTLVEDGHSGFLVDARDPAAYAERLARVLDDGQLAARFGWAGRRRAEHYTWARAAASLLKVGERCTPGRVGRLSVSDPAVSVERATPEELASLRDLIERWAALALATNPLLAAVDRDPERDRWYVRMKGEEKMVTTVWLTLRERTLHFETYFMPAPEEQAEVLYEYLLRANTRLFAWRFAIGLEDAVYLVGQLPVDSIDEEELDRIIGSGYAYSEDYFRSAMSIGYASKFRR